MSERDDLLSSIADTSIDYRQGDLGPPSTKHVDRWITQFDQAVQIPMLREMAHVLKSTYFSRPRTKNFLEGLFQTTKLVGNDPCSFWKSVNFLDIQGGGASQKEMLALFETIILRNCGHELSKCGGSTGIFMYLDDAIFTGNRVLRDIDLWISGNAPQSITLHIVCIALHSGGQYYAEQKLKAAAQRAGKKLDITWWRSIELEDRRAHTDSSDVLRPVIIPNDADVQAYVGRMRYAPHLRAAGQTGGKGIFSSDAGRQLLEQEFLKAGVRIRQMCPNLGDTQRPLGHMTLETLGFGSLIVTFRNCPNNTPLALWVGDPWYPLFARTTNSTTSLKLFLASLAKDSN